MGAEPEKENETNIVITPPAGRLKLTGSQTSTIISSVNIKFEEVATEISERIEKVAKTVSGSE